MAASTINADTLSLKRDNGKPLRLMVEAAELLYYMGRFEESDKVFTALSLVASEDPLGVLGLARNALAKGDFKVVSDLVSQAIRCRYAQGTDLARAQMYLGDALMNARRFREAQRAWEKAIQLSHGEPQMLADLSWRLSQVRNLVQDTQRSAPGADK